MNLSRNRLTDETGVKLARYLAASTTIERLVLDHNQLGSTTYLAMAAALRVNSSPGRLYLSGLKAADRKRIDAAFVEALWLNPVRPVKSVWNLYSFGHTDVDYNRLKGAAEQLGHPSFQILLIAEQMGRKFGPYSTD